MVPWGTLANFCESIADQPYELTAIEAGLDDTLVHAGKCPLL